MEVRGMVKIFRCVVKTLKKIETEEIGLFLTGIIPELYFLHKPTRL